LVEREIREALDACLCTESEMDSYRRQVRNFIDTTFTMAVADASSTSGPSLFDMTGTDHLDSDVNIRGG